MNDQTFARIFDGVPWRSRGRDTPLSQLAKSIVPLGNHASIKDRLAGSVADTSPDFESFLPNIEGSGFQVGRGKILTCRHVVDVLDLAQRNAYVLAHIEDSQIHTRALLPISGVIHFIDPRSMRSNPGIDVSIVIAAAVSKNPALPQFEIPPVEWGDSTSLGVGDRVLIGGYPLGRDMFVALKSNRMIVQPSFFDGIVSCIIPATNAGETRLLQVSSVALGGISGGVVCDPDTGKVLGMVTSGFAADGVSLPITYAIPSEVLQPWAAEVNFKVGDEVWR